MVRRQTRPTRRVWAGKAALLAGGGEVVAVRYQRASGDKKQEGKSVTDQGKENVRTVNSNGWRDGGSYTDNARSASRHATKERKDFERLIEDVVAGKGDVLVVWEISRKERDLAVYVKIRDLCLAEGLNFWMVGGNLYDLRDKNGRCLSSLVPPAGLGAGLLARASGHPAAPCAQSAAIASTRSTFCST